jgi:hypothetical protein
MNVVLPPPENAGTNQHFAFAHRARERVEGRERPAHQRVGMAVEMFHRLTDLRPRDIDGVQFGQFFVVVIHGRVTNSP